MSLFICNPLLFLCMAPFLKRFFQQLFSPHLYNLLIAGFISCAHNSTRNVLTKSPDGSAVKFQGQLLVLILLIPSSIQCYPPLPPNLLGSLDEHSPAGFIPFRPPLQSPSQASHPGPASKCQYSDLGVLSSFSHPASSHMCPHFQLWISCY